MKGLFQALANAADGTFVIDEDMRIIYWNQAAQDMLGYTYGEVTDQPCYEILAGHNDQGQLICRYYCRVAVAALTGGTVTNYDTYVRTKSDDRRWVNMSIFTFPANDDETRPVIVHMFRDATQKKHNEQFIYRVLEAAKALPDEDIPRANPPESAEHQVIDLTNREREVLSLLAQGFSTHDLTQSLSISPATARNHIRNILHKLQVHSRLEAVVYAFQNGLVTQD